MSFDTHWDVPWRTLHLGMIERAARDAIRGDARVSVEVARRGDDDVICVFWLPPELADEPLQGPPADDGRHPARITVSRIADADGWMVTMSMSSNRDATREFWMTVATYAERMAADLNARVWSL